MRKSWKRRRELCLYKRMQRCGNNYTYRGETVFVWETFIIAVARRLWICPTPPKTKEDVWKWAVWGVRQFLSAESIMGQTRRQITQKHQSNKTGYRNEVRAGSTLQGGYFVHHQHRLCLCPGTIKHVPWLDHDAVTHFWRYCISAFRDYWIRWSTLTAIKS